MFRSSIRAAICLQLALSRAHRFIW